MEELKTRPREYQKKIFETCTKENCLVILPTGTGKTLIAIMLAIERFKQFPLEKVLILAPTRPLVEQHFNSFKKNLPEAWAEMQIFTGKTAAETRKKIWQTSEFIFSTPQCIANDLKNNLYALENVCLLIEDECHKCLKNYSYNLIAQRYKEQAKNQKILGLTASPGSDKETILRVCNNLGINAVEIRTRESPDVKPYLQNLEFEKIDIEFPPEFEEIRQVLREIYNAKIEELKNRKIIFSNNISKIILLETQRKIINALSSGNKSPNMMVSASVCAQAIKLQHAIELLETQTIASFLSYIKEFFNAQKKSKAVERLTKDKRFIQAYTLALALTIEHPKLNKLKEIINASMQNNRESKIMIFTQYRETAKKIFETLSKVNKVKPKIFVGQAKKGEGKNMTGLNQKEQKKIIEDFSEGKINCLISTSIGEEGLDLPEVNEVIFYEPVPSAIRKIQRSGRTARIAPGALKILITKNTRDQTFHYVSMAKEKRMHSLIQNLSNEFNSNKEAQKTLF